MWSSDAASIAPSGAGRDDRVCVPGRNGLRGANEGRVGLRAHGLDGMVVHLDDLGGLDERQPVRVEPGRPEQDRLDLGGRRRERARDDLLGAVIASESVDGDPNGHRARV